MLCGIVVVAVVVVDVTFAAARLTDVSRDDDDDDQQMDVILKAIKMNAIRIVDTMPMKKGVESCALGTIKFSMCDKKKKKKKIILRKTF